MTEKNLQIEKKPKLRTGLVVSDKMDKTIVVEISYVLNHPLYKKRLQRSKKVKAHDEQELATAGDMVLIEETRPLASTKCWRLLEVIEEKPEMDEDKISSSMDSPEAFDSEVESDDTV